MISVILTFYRGGWCPYCNLDLRAYQQVLSQIEALGASLIAVSPQTPDASLSTAQKNNLTFDVLSDVGSHVAYAYGIAFETPKRLVSLKQGSRDNTAKSLLGLKQKLALG